ncbi:MAG: MBL fold metallo-hydrolase [Armatimonadetes bacterium CG_4_10_14_3_um_filter_66_18]|nr:MAG: MBL fold metallo-hydrolase [Armatimonadetes bacterium CG_4_8_14_3_um_filter_66_20]PIY47829.1 MAG: MBL fold metallo-hydrolase [Armatimonadetes bacterium CG_4_10_14_3_um_filter_66_18]PIZ36011.1 MAG: MBL fold metallo-hydrolase [Armatimonadetes bacterium CG_4_10_14_0_8_um_filter_66_14]
MKIRIWGGRGSLLTPGEHTRRYGGNTTCLEIRLQDDRLIVVDAGSGIRGLGNALLKEKDLSELCLVLTHAHWDHLMGFPFFVPAYLERFKLRVRGGPLAKVSLQDYLSHQMQPPFFPVEFSVMKANFDFSQGDPIRRCESGATLEPIRLSHPNNGYGHKFIENGKSFVFLTDNELDMQHERGLSRAEYVQVCEGADLLFHDAQYTDEEYQRKRGWGHSTYQSATSLALEAGVKRLGLFHHDPDRTDDDLDEQVCRCRQQLADCGSDLECFACREGEEIEL